MEHDGQAFDGDREFIDWLKKYKLMPYHKALEDEGFEDVESLTILTGEEIEELSTAVKMKFGHKKKFPVAIHKAREELEKREKQKQEQEKEQEEKAKRLKSKREKEEQEQEEKSKRLKEEEQLTHELARIERERKLFEAKARQLKVEESKETEDPKAANSKTDTAQKRSTELPAWKVYAAFISHKKMHTVFGDSSETLSIRLKVPI
jgi:hypothetical protein